ncbi:SDR family NAD(P)-dependent oxidoreductase [Tropicibacter sp. Alg240-R139]|uniref:SDR family NAD(P)-dependent oxidoreductase n=1 Tax=Tropicibacter sp. Alg240-R139 TaxID=2305991 RepID=UPI0013DF307D|nr:SDR family NAD(P)-dependent oxidoreductase [Tropicibacter sp. Alg240-R139]
MEFEGKIAFVTGAANGIGLAISKSLGRRGMRVMLTDIDGDKLIASCAMLCSEGIDAAWVECDVSDPASVGRAAEATLARFGKVHFLANNAGVSLGGQTGTIPIKDWNWILGINLMGAVHCTEVFVPVFKAQNEGGFILNTASMAGHLALPGGGPYNASKFGLVGYSEALRQEFASTDIGVGLLCPGWVRTDIHKSAQESPSNKEGDATREETDQDRQVAAAIDAGLEPDVVAEWTLDQIGKGRFYIFTQADLAPFVAGRFAEIETGLQASTSIEDYALEHAIASGQEPLDVAVIGAGFSGVCAAIKLQESGIVNFRVFEKSSGIGGTWWHNRYPGAACDIPSHFYCYSFEMNPDWSRFYAPQQEIQSYIAHCADKYSVRDRISLNCEITDLQFDESSSLWIVLFADGSEVRTRFVVNGAGGLHKPFIPELPGRENFDGIEMHTAEWDEGFDPSGKRIAVIGSAASAIQAVPQLAKTAAQVTLFQRTPNYIAARQDFAYSDEQKHSFRRDLAQMQAVRDEQFKDKDTRLYPIVVSPAIRRVAEAEIKAHMRSQIDDPDLAEKLMPDYELGCKRILISDDFLPTLNRSNVALETAPITAIEPTGVISKETLTQVDAIIYATGFDIEGQRSAFRVTGQRGRSLDDIWQTRADAYKSSMVPDLPNYFLVTGPNSGVGTTSVVYLIEQSVDWIVDVIKLAGRDRLVSVSKETCLGFGDAMQSQLDNTVWASGCDSWYIGSNGRIETLYPGNAQDFANQMSHVDEAEFVLTKLTANKGKPPHNWTPRRQVNKDLALARKLDSTIGAILSSPDAKNGPKMHEMSAVDARVLFSAMVERLEAPISIVCAVENGTMELDGRTLNYRVYRPDKAGSEEAGMVYFHGGGWVIGDLDTHDNACRALAAGSGVTLVSVDYRRAPEFQFPAPVEDAQDAYLWVVRNAAALGLDATRIGVGGDSAGANLAAVTAQLLRDAGGPQCAWSALIYPSVAAGHETPSSIEFAEGFGLDATLQDWFARHYIPEGVDWDDPRISPLKADSHANLPPALIATAGFDPLRDAGQEFATALRDAGVPVDYVEYSSLIHGFKSWAGIVPDAAEALHDIAARLGTLAGTQGRKAAE